MYCNDVCPITLDDLKTKLPGHIFVHRGVGMDIRALYEYLLNSLYFTNPVNRIPFELQDLRDLEKQMTEAYGEDVINTPEPTAAPPIAMVVEEGPQGVGVGTSEPEWDLPDHAWFNATTLAPRMSLTIDPSSLPTDLTPGQATPTVRLRVDLDLNLAPFESVVDAISDDESASEASTTTTFVAMSPENSSANLLDHPPSTPLPAKSSSSDDLANSIDRPLASVVQLFQDTERATRMKEQLNVLHFLLNDAAEVLKQMLAIATDNAFHDYVWTQTSTAILSTVTRFIQERGTARQDDDVVPQVVAEEFHFFARPDNLRTMSSSSVAEGSITGPTSRTVAATPFNNYNLEVVYNDCWEIYRIMVMHVLEGRYIDICRDVLQVSRNELRVLIDAHNATIRQEEQRQGTRLTLVRDIISSTSRMLDPERCHAAGRPRSQSLG